MSAEKITAYQDALRKLKDASAAAAALASIVERAGKALATWQIATVTNISTGGGYPAALVARPHNPNINAHDWPTIEHIHNTLIAFHDAASAAKSAWSAIPAEDRIGLAPPPGSN
ncbi:hypothetical protein VT84_14065 [Gemmata sp. SH-PL17]|uniref:hypothetical protein n=1 Tax=Gemmata sp. SH-PL17 TaxID=1630693 RepID=UPI00078D67C2|nr:hypothetical protein [Gemmata sp. SH-PL17]AMV25519.1 hypothetical protein VT84_14065 [Gemmata sp. SH-PL17]